jgi:RsiW-degrading membrane proteinase PrsW (M82 family)
MERADILLWLLAALLGAVWALATSWRAPRGTLYTAARGVLGGVGAVGIALCAYGLLQAAGFEPRWDRVLAGGWEAVGLAVVIGLVEEAAKLLGIVLAREGDHPRGLRGALRVTAGVAAAYAVLEAALTLRGAALPLAVGRTALAPVAHAALSVPIGLAVAAGAAVGGRGWLRLLAALLVSAALHGAADWSLTLPRFGPVLYAAALLAPTLWLFVHVRRLAGWPMPWEAAWRAAPARAMDSWTDAPPRR